MTFKARITDEAREIRDKGNNPKPKEGEIMSSEARAGEQARQAVTPYLCVKDSAAAIEFYRRAFQATELTSIPMPDGRIGHAEIKIGNATIMMADEYPEIKFLSPQSLGGSAVMIHVYVDDVDALARQAVSAGATLARPVADQDYGDRNCKIEDPFGHVWLFATAR
jgi:PhnB protein